MSLSLEVFKEKLHLQHLLKTLTNEEIYNINILIWNVSHI